MNKQKNKRLVSSHDKRRIDRERSKVMGFILLGLFTLVFGAVFVNVVLIQVTHSYKGRNLLEYATNIYTQVIEDEAKRGSIYSADGEPLAINVASFDLYAILDVTNIDIYTNEPDYVEDPDATADALLEALDLTSNQAANEMFHTQLGNEEIANTKYGQVEFGSYGKDLTLEQKETIEALDLPGVKFRTNSKRYYPYGDFASYVIGFLKTNENGEEEGTIGIEQFIDGYLQGHDRRVFGTFDGSNISINQEQQDLIEKTDGSDVVLTIDSNIQGFIQSAMLEHYPEDEFESAFTMVMDPHDGSILGAYALPSFNPNLRNNIEMWYNPYTDFCYEPGSTIKTLLVGTAMEEGVWNPSQTFESGTITKEKWGEDAEGEPIHISDYTYNVYGTTWGTLNWTQGYFLSSNVAMVQILEAVTDEVWGKSATDRFEMGSSVKTSLMETASCSWAPRYSLDYATSTFGQGVTANAMQMLQAYSVFANNGNMVTPHFIESMTNPVTGEQHYLASEDELIQPREKMSEENATQVLELMEQVAYDTMDGNEPASWVRGGFRYADATDVRIGVKTGTAEISSAQGYGDVSTSSKIHSAMIVAPIDDPQIILYSVGVDPSSDFTGYSALADGEIIDNTIKYLNGQNHNQVSEFSSNTFYVEDFRGEEINEVATSLKEQGVNVITIGEGTIVNQYPSSEQEISQNQDIVLKAEGDYDFDDLKGKTFRQASSICYALNWECTFDGLGIVDKVEKISDVEYNLIMKEPDYIADDLTSKELYPEE